VFSIVQTLVLFMLILLRPQSAAALDFHIETANCCEHVIGVIPIYANRLLALLCLIWNHLPFLPLSALAAAKLTLASDKHRQRVIWAASSEREKRGKVKIATARGSDGLTPGEMCLCSGRARVYSPTAPPVPPPSVDTIY
jgi:hypothetical protein